MLYYRSRTGGRDISRATARTISAASLLLYPAGALIVNFSHSPAGSVGGYALVLASLVCVATLMASSIQRIVGEQVDRLDEYELKLRSRAVGSAYACLAALALLAIIYCALASDRGGWVPSTYGEFNGLFWGTFLYASMLPSLFLAWQIDASDARPDA